MITILLAVAFSLLSVVEAIAQTPSYIDACAKVLQQTTVSSVRNELLEYAILNYVVANSSDEFDFKAKFAGLTGYGFFEGNLSSARKKLAYYENTLNLHWNKAELRHILGHIYRQTQPIALVTASKTYLASQDYF